MFRILRYSSCAFHSLSGNSQKLFMCRRQFSQAAGHYNDLKKMFPQIDEAEKNAANGNYAVAIELLTDVKNILYNATGEVSPMTISVRLRAADLLRNLANVQTERKLKTPTKTVAVKIETLLKKVKGPENPDINTRLEAYNILTSMHFASGHMQAADTYISEALLVLENKEQDSSSECPQTQEAHLDHFARIYSWKGLVSLYNRDFDNAEMFLQMAARWAQNKTMEMICLNNLGALCWYKGTDELRNRLDYDTQLTGPRQSQGIVADPVYGFGMFTYNRGNVLVGWSPPNDGDATKSDEALNTLTMSATDALHYWQDAIDVATQASSSPSAASSMCGPTNTAATDSSTTTSMLGPDYAPKEIPSNSSIASSEDQSDATSSIDPNAVLLESNLANETFTVAYVSLLCNAAMGESVANRSTGKSSELLSSALQVIDKHKACAVAPSSDAVSAITGRVLGLIAMNHLSTGNLLTCEGLLRSAKKHLSGKATLSDARYSLESALVDRMYGQMLQQWEKRENEGKHLMLFANEKLNQLPLCYRGVRISCLVQYPV